MYDVIIIGGGPAGVTASIYSQRYQLKTLLITKNIGGMIQDSHILENYPGFTKISGTELSKKFQEQLKNLKVEIKEEEVTNIEKNENFTITNKKNNKYETKNIILALGTKKRKLNIPGEEKFLGKGISYCYTCDAPLFKDKIVAVVGGSDSAAKASLLLANYTKKTYIIYRKENLRCEPHYLKKIKSKNIEILNNTKILEIRGKEFVESVSLSNKEELKLDGIFIEIGTIPLTNLAKKLNIKLDENNYIITNEKQETNIKGIYATGDITNKQLKQIITAAAQGAIAADSIFRQ